MEAAEQATSCYPPVQAGSILLQELPEIELASLNYLYACAEGERLRRVVFATFIARHADGLVDEFRISIPDANTSEPALRAAAWAKLHQRLSAYSRIHSGREA